MTVTVTLNPCIDKTVELSSLRLNETNRVDSVREDVSGKGINVSVALKQLGYDTICTGFDRADSGDTLVSALNGYGIPHRLIKVGGRLRCNLKLFDSGRREMTELIESGEPVGEDSAEAFMSMLKGELSGADVVVCSGSAAPGVRGSIYKEILAMAKAEFGCKTILDAHGELFKEGLLAKPDFIKPNIFELQEHLGRKLFSQAEMIAACRELTGAGVGAVCLSMGKDGAMLVTSEHSWFSPSVPITVRGVQGAGDSMIAGICAALFEGLSGDRLLCFAVSAAQASLQREGTLLCTREGFEAMRKAVTARQID